MRQLIPAIRRRTYLQQWLEDLPVRAESQTNQWLTSLFYNFVWIWQRSAQQSELFTDWRVYDFTVSSLRRWMRSQNSTATR